MVALWIRAGTLVAGDGALGIRLLAPLAAALGSWLLWDAGERLLPGRGAGLVAAALLNSTLVLGAGAVTMRTPDTPLLFFWVCTLWALARLPPGGAATGPDRVVQSRSGAWWLAVGLFAGLALDSKYTAAFLVLGIGLWLLLGESGGGWRDPGRGWVWFWGSPWWRRCWRGTPRMAGQALPRQGGRIEQWHPARAGAVFGRADRRAGWAGDAAGVVAVRCWAGSAGVPAGLAG